MTGSDAVRKMTDFRGRAVQRVRQSVQRPFGKACGYDGIGLNVICDACKERNGRYDAVPVRQMNNGMRQIQLYAAIAEDVGCSMRSEAFREHDKLHILRAAFISVVLSSIPDGIQGMTQGLIRKDFHSPVGIRQDMSRQMKGEPDGGELRLQMTGDDRLRRDD